MNSGRTKYTSTPTYGMQKRGFGKRQTVKQPETELDFTQKPAPSFDAPVLGASDPYMMPQGIYHNPVPPQQNSGQYQPPAPPMQGVNGTAPAMPVNAGMNGMYAARQDLYNMYSGTDQPVTGMPLPQMPPLANASTPSQPVDASGRAQGFVPPQMNQPMQSQAPFTRQQNAVQPPVMQQNAIPQASAFPQYDQQPYFSAQQPMQQPGGFPDYSGGGIPPVQPPQPPGGQNKPPVNIENWLKMLLYIILPVVFVLCIALRDEGFDILRYLFMTGCAASIGMLWYRQAFNSSLRTGITIGYGLMCLIVVIMMVTGSSSDVVQRDSTITAQPTATITTAPTDALGYQADQAPVTTPPVQLAPGETEAGLQLAAFMDNWAMNNVEAMLNYVQPSWRSKQTDPETELFRILTNRTPLNYEIEAISGTDGDTSRSLTMAATIDKNNGKDPVRYRFMVLMDNENGDWYVDPNSLSSNEEEEAEETIVPDNIAAMYTAAPRTTVTPVPPPDTLLYYNPNGGRYYHADPECDSVNEKYLPMASFTYGEINDSPYKSLIPCLKCNAPTN